MTRSETTDRTAKLKEQLDQVPSVPGCYIYRDGPGSILYVGKAVNLRSRVRSYFQPGSTLGSRIARMVSAVRDLEWMVTDNEVEALILESILIKKHRPPFNIRLRDDKSYPYACVTVNEPYPRLFFTRRPRLTRDGNLYFGPFTNARALRDSLRTIRRVFGIQTCRKQFTGELKYRPCLYYHLGQCLGPCTGELPQALYREAIKKAVGVLEGRQEEIIRQMSSEMDQASEELAFERAAAIRDRINALEQLTSQQKMFSIERVDQDIVGIARDGLDTLIHVFFVRKGRLIGQENFSLDADPADSASAVIGQFIKQYYEGAGAIPAEILVPEIPEDAAAIEQWLTGKRGRKSRVLKPIRGEKRKYVGLVTKNAEIALENRQKQVLSDSARREQACMELAEALGLDTPPVRIECYDISNLMGGFTVASMVVFEDGAPAKSQYRHFRIRTVEGQDDFASMHEVITRRLKRAAEGDQKFSDMPDLMLIDGGKGQLGAAMKAVAEAGDDQVALAALAKREEQIYLPERFAPVSLPRHSAALRLVQSIRDEAHRFAISYHRKLRGKGSLTSELDSIAGIGKRRRTSLVKHFGSVDQIRQASLEQIAKAPGMNTRAARSVYEQLHKDETIQEPEQ